MKNKFLMYAFQKPKELRTSLLGLNIASFVPILYYQSAHWYVFAGVMSVIPFISISLLFYILDNIGKTEILVKGNRQASLDKKIEAKKIADIAVFFIFTMNLIIALLIVILGSTLKIQNLFDCLFVVPILVNFFAAICNITGLLSFIGKKISAIFKVNPKKVIERAVKGVNGFLVDDVPPDQEYKKKDIFCDNNEDEFDLNQKIPLPKKQENDFI